MERTLNIIIAIGAIFALLLVLAGCKAPNFQLENKAVTISGYSSVNLLRTGYDPATQTVTPSMTSIISSGMYNSVPTGTGCKDYLFYNAETNTSIWNSNSKDSQQSLIFATSDKEMMKQVISALTENIKTIPAAPDSGEMK